MKRILLACLLCGPLMAQAQESTEATEAAARAEAKRNECLLRGVQQGDRAVTLEELRRWCDPEQQQRSAHEDALRGRLALERSSLNNPFALSLIHISEPTRPY